MAGNEDRIIELLGQSQRTLDYIARHQGVIDGKPGKGYSSYKPDYKSMGLFGKAVSRVTSSIELMHGSAETFANHLGHLAVKLGAGIAITSALSGIMDLGKSFTKMADIGQTFGGSMFEMAAQAGESGLSLDEFTKMLAKNSAATAVLTSTQTGAASGMGELQKAVRTSLKPMGLYGMNLSELTDMTSDYAESLRLTGQLNKMDSDQQRKAIVQLAGDVSSFSAATGKSREAMLKSINETMRETSAAMRMTAQPLGDAQKVAYSSFVSFFSSMPGIAGDQLPKFFAQLYGTGGNAFFTEFGKSMTEAGLPQINAAMGKMVKSMQGGVMDLDASVDATMQMRDVIVRNQKTLQAQANAGNQAAAQALAFAQSLAGLDRAALKEKMKQKQAEDNYTKAVMNFEGEFHEVTGKFRTGFYKSFAESTKSFDMTKGSGKDTMDALKDTLNKLGVAFGTLLGKVFSEDNIRFIGSQLDILANWFTKIADDPTLLAKIEDLEKSFVSLVETIGWAIGKVHGFFASFLSDGPALMATILTTIFAPRIIKGLFGLAFRSLAVRAGVVNVNTGIGSGGAGPLPDWERRAGATKPRMSERMAGLGTRMSEAGARRGGVLGWLSRMGGSVMRGGGHLLGAGGSVLDAGSGIASKVGGFGSKMMTRIGSMGSKLLSGAKVLGKGVIGGALTFVAGLALDALPDFTGKGALESVMNGAGYGASIGALLGPQGAIVGGIIGGIGMLIWDNFDTIKDKIGSMIVGVGSGAKWLWDSIIGSMKDWLWSSAPTGTNTVATALPNTPENASDKLRADVAPVLNATPAVLDSMSAGDLKVKLDELETIKQRDQAANDLHQATVDELKELITITKAQNDIVATLMVRNNKLAQDQIDTANRGLMSLN